MHFESLTFFRPPELERERSRIAAETFNRCRLLLRRSPSECCFVPIRSMQFQGVVGNQEIIFVDSQGYAVHGGEGGRLIVLAWQLAHSGTRDSLTDPVPIDLVRYQPLPREQEWRLLGEFDKAMQLLLERQLEGEQAGGGVRVVPIHGG